MTWDYKSYLYQYLAFLLQVLFFANLAFKQIRWILVRNKDSNWTYNSRAAVIILYSIPLIVFSSLNMSFSIFKVISFIGGISLIAFGILYVVRNISKIDNRPYAVKSSRIENPVLVGIFFTGLNPFFFLWWISVGFKLISDSIGLLGYPLGIVFLFSCIWMDYAWLGLTSYFASRGIKAYTIKVSQIDNHTVNSSSFLLWS